MFIGVLMEYTVDAHDMSGNSTRISTGKPLIEVNNVGLSQITPGVNIVQQRRDYNRVNYIGGLSNGEFCLRHNVLSERHRKGASICPRVFTSGPIKESLSIMPPKKG